jgi:hypothetical protein
VILCVVKMDKLTTENLLVLDMLEKLFGKDVWKHVILVLSHCSLAPEKLAELIDELPQNNKLKDVWLRCEKRAVAIENYPHFVLGHSIMSDPLLQSCAFIHRHMVRLQASGLRYTNEAFETAAKVMQDVREETKGEWDLLQHEHNELEAQKLKGSIDQAVFETRVEELKKKERDFAEKKLAMQLERFQKDLARSAYFKGVLMNLGLSLALAVPAVLSFSGTIIAVGSAAAYATPAIRAAGQALALTSGYLVRFGAVVAAGAGVSRLWNGFGRNDDGRS